jgi:histidinol-phosphate aminotransferase
MIDYIKEIETEKQRMMKSVSELGVIVYPSYTNLLLMKTTIPNISKKLIEQGVLVHDASNQLGAEYFRVTIGSKEENNLFLESLKNII